MLTTFWLGVAATIVGSIVLSFVVWVLKQFEVTPAVKLWRLISKGISWIVGRLLLMSSRAVGILPHRRHKLLRGDTDSLQETVELLQERVQELEESVKETRWLELDTRRDTYRRVCHRLSPNVHVTAVDGPKVLVRIGNEVPGLSAADERQYFSMVPSEGKVNATKWIVDAELSRRILELFGDDENNDTYLRLIVVTLDDGESHFDLRWDQVRPIRAADGKRRAILTIERSDWSIGAFEVLNSIVAVLTVNAVAPILVKHDKLVPKDSKVRGRSDGE